MLTLLDLDIFFSSSLQTDGRYHESAFLILKTAP